MDTQTAVTHDGMTVPKRHVVPVEWRYGPEYDDVGVVIVEGPDAEKLVQGLAQLLELRDAVIGLATLANRTGDYGDALVELREKARKLLSLDMPEGAL